MPITESEGATIAYEVTGAGEPMVLIMGFAVDSRMWMMQTPAFAQQYKVITFDNRGVGASSGPGATSMEQMARDALAVMDAAGVERAHIVGISMGGAIAQHLALMAPQRVRSLALVATWCAPNGYTQRVAKLGGEILETIGREALLRASMLWLFTPGFFINNADFAAAIEGTLLQFAVDPAVYFAQRDALLDHDTRARLGELQMPVLVMVGRRDILVPPELSEQIVAEIPHAEFVMLETAHGFNLEETEAFNKTILEFAGRN